MPWQKMTRRGKKTMGLNKLEKASFFIAFRHSCYSARGQFIPLTSCIVTEIRILCKEREH